MNYASIKKFDIADGTGVRVSLFVSGCRNHCEGCFQPETWDFNYGKEFTSDTMEEILQAISPLYITGFTILGGEPFEEENQKTVLSILETIHKTYPKKSIWAYTGYTLEKDLVSGGIKHTQYTDRIVNLLDVLVDGKFILAKKNISLTFRGSTNQRIIDVKSTIKQKKIVLLDF